MTQPEINKYITEKVLGEKWHKELSRRVIDITVLITCNCGEEYRLPEIWQPFNRKHLNPDFSQWEHYGPMLEKCMEKEWWLDYITYLIKEEPYCNEIDYSTILLKPALGSRVIVEFLKGRKWWTKQIKL